MKFPRQRRSTSFCPRGLLVPQAPGQVAYTTGIFTPTVGIKKQHVLCSEHAGKLRCCIARAETAARIRNSHADLRPLQSDSQPCQFLSHVALPCRNVGPPIRQEQEGGLLQSCSTRATNQAKGDEQGGCQRSPAGPGLFRRGTRSKQYHSCQNETGTSKTAYC